MNVAEAFDPIRALTASWRLLLRSPLPLFVGGAILMTVGGGGVHGWMFRDHDHHLSGEAVAWVLSLSCCCGLLGLLLSSWISIGLAIAVENTVMSGSARFEDLFASKGRFFDMVLLRILVALISLAAAIPFVLIVLAASLGVHALQVPPGVVLVAALFLGFLYLTVFLYVLLGFSLSVQAVAIEGLAPTAALRRSWSLVRSHRLRLLLYWVALAIFTVLGFCLCCIGVFWTGAMAHVAANDSYLALVKADEYAGSWLSTGNAPVSPATPS